MKLSHLVVMTQMQEGEARNATRVIFGSDIVNDEIPDDQLLTILIFDLLKAMLFEQTPILGGLMYFKETLVNISTKTMEALKTGAPIPMTFMHMVDNTYMTFVGPKEWVLDSKMYNIIKAEASERAPKPLLWTALVLPELLGRAVRSGSNLAGASRTAAAAPVERIES